MALLSHRSRSIEHVFGCLDDLEEAIGKLAASEAPVDAIALRAQMDRLEYVWLRAVRDAETSGVWQAEGYVSCAAWLRDQCRLTHTDAASTVKLARTLDAMPAVAAAFETGTITRRHAQVISHARTPERARAFEPLDETLADAATTLTVEQLHTVVRHACDTIDTDRGLSHDQQQHQQRAIYLSSLLDGMHALNGTLDPETNEIVRTCLDHYMDQDHTAGDPRSAPQRRCDALAHICHTAMAAHHTTDHRRNPPHLNVIVDLETIETRGGADLAAHIRIEATHGPLSRATLERIACDCKISRIITDGNSQPLDVGRARRTVTDAQWKALVIRDRGCVEPGCDRPPRWCHAHHKRWWEHHHGPTNLDNLELRCDHHHRNIHQHPPPTRE